MLRGAQEPGTDLGAHICVLSCVGHIPPPSCIHQQEGNPRLELENEGATFPALDLQEVRGQDYWGLFLSHPLPTPASAGWGALFSEASSQFFWGLILGQVPL